MRAWLKISARFTSLSPPHSRNPGYAPDNGLCSYFLSEDESQGRFKRLAKLFSSPMTEICLLFYQSVLTVFTRFNMFLQREDPCVHLIYKQCQNLLQKILSKFIKVLVIKAGTHLPEILYQEKENLTICCLLVLLPDRN